MQAEKKNLSNILKSILNAKSASFEIRKAVVSCRSMMELWWTTYYKKAISFFSKDKLCIIYYKRLYCVLSLNTKTTSAALY